MKLFIHLLIGGILLVGCNKPNTNEIDSSTYISIIVDITDPIEVRPNPNQILSLYNFSEYPDKEAFFRLTTISDKKLNPVVEYHLADGKTTERRNRTGDPHYRAKLVLTLYAEVRNTITNFWRENDSLQSLDHSECLSTIASELSVLTKSNATEKILVVYSDLLENSNFNSYVSCNKSRLKKSPEKVAKQLNADALLPVNLTGCTVFFIYRPLTREEDQKYQLVQDLYENLLKSRGALVVTKASNNFFIQ